MVCILGMGDCGNKSDVKSITNIKNISKTMTNMVSDKSQNVKVTNFNTQENTILVKAPPDLKDYGLPNVKNCRFVNNQEMDATQDVSITLNYENTTSLKQQVEAALKQANKDALTQKTAFLQTSSNKSNNYSEVNNLIENLVSTNITDTVQQKISQIMENAQRNTLTIDGPIECDVGAPPVNENFQKMLVKQLSKVLTKALTGTTVEAVTKTATDVQKDTKIDQTGGGIADFVSAVFSGFAGLMKGPLMVIVIGIVLLAGLAFVFKGTISKIAEKRLGFGRRRRFGKRSTSYGRRR